MVNSALMKPKSKPALCATIGASPIKSRNARLGLEQRLVRQKASDRPWTRSASAGMSR
jgi:hypothetical protein